MRRREFLALLAGAMTVSPVGIRAQQSDRVTKKLSRIGVLSSSPVGDQFYHGLREHGYLEGQNLIIERRLWQGQREQLIKFAAELADARVDLIVAVSTVDALAAKQATSTIPIVTVTPGDLVGVGLAASLARPGGNA